MLTQCLSEKKFLRFQTGIVGISCAKIRQFRRAAAFTVSAAF
ncbi:hypothetical protein HMPREF9370_1863 [Neisseria wadsworthii 9715]|uniref:Uncharacterized protein n=1 Tax=Neisseria wadsworthii 9715 TaxID=1030841 RepID=G4CS03_9NEIS|nr:hypothetical protein HMPREF9370_1863 [Neisseria wadsworthii 9715]